MQCDTYTQSGDIGANQASEAVAQAQILKSARFSAFLQYMHQGTDVSECVCVCMYVCVCVCVWLAQALMLQPAALNNSLSIIATTGDAPSQLQV